MIKRNTILWLLVILVGFAVSSSTFAATLEILCAPAMRKPIEEMRRNFEKKTGINTLVSYEGSGALLAQLRLKPRGDLFIPADRFYTDEAVKRKLAESPKVFAYLTPVIMVQKGNKHKINNLNDLLNKKLRIGLGDIRAGAIGKVTDEVIKKNKMSSKLNVVYWASKVDELANAIKLKSVDAVIIWKPVAMQYPKNGDIINIPAKKNVVAPVSAAIVKSSPNKEIARDFMAYMTSDAGKAIFTKHKYPTTRPK